MEEGAVPPPDTAAGHPQLVVPCTTYAHHGAHLVPAPRGWVLDADKGSNFHRLERTGTVVIPGLGVLGTFGGATVAALGSGSPFLSEGLGVGWNTRAERVSIYTLGQGNVQRG